MSCHVMCGVLLCVYVQSTPGGRDAAVSGAGLEAFPPLYVEFNGAAAPIKLHPGAYVLHCTAHG